jgi:hypothetical protein
MTRVERGQPMTTGTISPWPLVRKGDQQHPVKTLQYLLRARGHNVTVDGIFGAQLRRRRPRLPAGPPSGHPVGRR